MLSGLASGSPDYFEVLQVSRNATAAEIKGSFYRRAKSLHPDVNRGVHPEEARRKFQELSDAYATLSDENLRSSHEMMLDLRAKGAFSVGVSGQAPRREPKRPQGSADWDPWAKRSRASGGGDAGEWGSSSGSPYDPTRGLRRKTDSWFEAVQAEFKQALAKAYQGPRFHAEEAGRMYPFDFEAEERAAQGIHDHILQVVSGRQLLGHVQEVRLPALRSGEASNPSMLADRATHALPDEIGDVFEACCRKQARPASACAGGSVGGTTTSRSDGRSSARQDRRVAGGPVDHATSVLELVWMGRVVAVAVAKVVRPGADDPSARASGPTSTRRDPYTSVDDEGVDEDEGADRSAWHRVDRLESLTIYGDRGFWRRSPFDGNGDDRGLVRGHAGARHDADARGHKDAADAIDAGVIARVRGHGLKHKRRPHISDIFGPDGELSHRMASTWTPGVHHLAWMSTRTGRVECRAMRGWMPPSKIWLFEPRADTHDIGGWYFERLRRRGTFDPRDGVDQEASTLDPAVPILVAAHRTLRREQRDKEAAVKSRKMKEKLSFFTGLRGGVQAATESRFKGPRT